MKPRFLSNIAAQFSLVRGPLLLFYVPAVLLLAALVVVCWAKGLPMWRFTRDPSQINVMHPLTGLVSNLGVLCWAASAGMTVLAAAVCSNRRHSRRVVGFFVWATVATGLLLFDDLFLGHEKIFPELLGVSEQVVFGVYAAFVAGGMFVYRDVIVRTDYLLLLIALAAFGSSILVDQLIESGGQYYHLFEDGPKFIGIVGWFAYFAWTSFEILTGRAVYPS